MCRITRDRGLATPETLHWSQSKAKLLGWESIPAIVKELSDVDAAPLVLIEDQQRQDASPLERARGYQRLKEKFALPQEEIAGE